MIFEGRLPQNNWTNIENDYFDIRYHRGFLEDAKNTLSIAMNLRESTYNLYSYRLSPKVRIKLYSSREEIKAVEDATTAISHTPLNNPEIGILRPSWDRDWDGYEQLDNPFTRVLNHEYVHCVFYDNLYRKNTGYKNPPNWFCQGVAEYLSSNYLPSYETKIRSKILGESFYIDCPYSWGIYIVEYIYENYGQEKMINLISSAATTFASAIEQELGCYQNEFNEEWKEYISEKFSSA